jgi:uncharacterized membrane protein YeaQ/YmgE (transglycosylase-associated protein family)
MGLALWFASGLAAFFFARIIPSGRQRGWLGELVTAVTVAVLCGLAASALDFAGWRELDWRAGLFAFSGAFAAAGVFRLVTIFRRRPLQ